MRVRRIKRCAGEESREAINPSSLKRALVCCNYRWTDVRDAPLGSAQGSKVGVRNWSESEFLENSIERDRCQLSGCCDFDTNRFPIRSEVDDQTWVDSA